MTSQNYPETSQIINGPGKYDLFLALFEGKKVWFEVRTPKSVLYRFPVLIHSLENSRHEHLNWRISGRVRSLDERGFNARYDSRTREGVFCITTLIT